MRIRCTSTTANGAEPGSMRNVPIGDGPALTESIRLNSEAAFWLGEERLMAAGCCGFSVLVGQGQLQVLFSEMAAALSKCRAVEPGADFSLIINAELSRRRATAISNRRFRGFSDWAGTFLGL